MIQYSEIKRSIPALGTFFEIKCLASNNDVTQSIITRAFAYVTELENILSFHNENSELSIFNKTGKTHEKNLRVLFRISSILHTKTDGIFNVYKPHIPYAKQIGNIDLGGIAKGFIVDKISKFLVYNGIIGGIINAGGDIRVFGSYIAPIHIRDPFDFTKNHFIGDCANKSVASSCITENAVKYGGKSKIYGKSDIVHATVIGSCCTICDAMTKVILINPERGTKILELLKYKAIMIDKHRNFFTYSA